MSGAPFVGFATAGAQLVLIKPKRPKRGFKSIQTGDGSGIALPDIVAQAVVEEKHIDRMEITDHPVEQGANINDHAFKRPARLVLELAWSTSPSSTGSLTNAAIGFGAATNAAIQNAVAVFGVAKAVVTSLSGGTPGDPLGDAYQALLRLQATKALFSVLTAKRTYTNMVCESLTTHTDAKTANALLVTMECKQVILVNSRTVALDPSVQAEPSATASPVDRGVQQLVPKQ